MRLTLIMVLPLVLLSSTVHAKGSIVLVDFQAYELDGPNDLAILNGIFGGGPDLPIAYSKGLKIVAADLAYSQYAIDESQPEKTGKPLEWSLPFVHLTKYSHFLHRGRCMNKLQA